MASFDAVYSVTPMSHANEMRSVNDRLESGANGLINIDVVASVIKGVLRFDRAET